MTAEKLSEALSYIDDDIIEETEDLRSRKPNHKIIWLRCLSVAACLCIALVAVLGGVQTNPDLDLLGFKGEEPWAGTQVGGHKYGAGGTLGAQSVDEVAYLEITEWQKNCFYATAIEGKNDAFDDGAKVKVKFFSEWVWVRQNVDLGWYEYKNKIPSDEEFPIGSKVFVIFNHRRNTFLNGKADEVITAFVIECDGTERWK